MGGLFRQRQVTEISVHGGAPVSLASAPNGRGGSWGEDGYIIFVPGPGTGLSRISENGGAPELITNPASTGHFTHRWPQVLRGGASVLFTASDNGIDFEAADLEVVSIKDRQIKKVWQGGYFGRYLPTGHLVFVHEGTLLAAPFDIGRLQTAGSAAPVLADIYSTPQFGGSQFDFSQNGIFAYVNSGAAGLDRWPLVWMDDAGRTAPALPPARYLSPRLSADGKRVAYTKGGRLQQTELYVYDLAAKMETRLTFGGQNKLHPAWALGGERLIFVSKEGPVWRINWVRAAGGEQPELLYESRRALASPSISPDGRWLVFAMLSPDTASDIFIAPLDLADPEHPKLGTPQPLIRTTAGELTPAVSPDGKWIAYASNEGGELKLYVQRFTPGAAGAGGKWEVSTGSGVFPVWSRSAQRLFITFRRTTV
jgi:serine/threonine-protein kinase